MYPPGDADGPKGEKNFFSAESKKTGKNRKNAKNRVKNRKK
jgi:hypothetical protein